MTTSDELLRQIAETQSEIEIAERRLTASALSAVRLFTLAEFPQASGVLAIESDQGSFLWFDAVVDPSHPNGRIDWADLDDPLGGKLAQLSQSINDTERRGLWLPYATEVEGGWIIYFDALPR